jgi:predicted  nucleic acid-binding Zn-ribbon protein
MFGESTDHSGIVGFLVGLVVLVFVGIGFSLVVDKRLKFSSGKADVEQALTEEKLQLEALRRQTEVVRKDYEEKARPLMDQPAELEKLKLAVSSSVQRLAELRDQQVALKDAVEAEALSFAEYRATFRKKARQAAAGEKLPQLEVVGGKIYRDVTIRRVTRDGIEAAHSQGVSTLKPEDLGDSWQQRFQWDAEESAEVVNAGRVPTDPSGKPVEKQVPGRKQSEKEEQVPVISPEKLAKQEMEKKLSSLRRDVTEAKRHLENAEAEVSRARTNSLTNRGKSVPGSLETWDERITRLEGGAEIFRARYLAARGKLAAENPEDPMLREIRSSP